MPMWLLTHFSFNANWVDSTCPFLAVMFTVQCTLHSCIIRAGSTEVEVWLVFIPNSECDDLSSSHLFSIPECHHADLSDQI